MSSTDDRIINMQFDNAQFEKNLANTMKSIDQLQKSLDFQNAATGIDKVNDAASKFSMETVTKGIEGVSGKFLALTTIGITALTKITGAAIDAGKKVADAFVIDPAKQGFAEYETKIGSIQTILANTARYGTKLPEVTDNLNKLNDYADKTIYNFGEMTKNIGLFTNAGIKVGDATSMIKGFSNAAAASGTTAEGAAGAAYQLSQALSAGQIRLMDWRSLTNVGMGNKNMQDSLIQLAQGMGVFKETGDDATAVAKDFNGSLESGWLKADVMSTYLKIMAGEMTDAEMASKGLTKTQIAGMKAQAATAQEAATKVRTFTQLTGTIKESVGSAWAAVFEQIVGDFDTATALFTGINNVVGKVVGNVAKHFEDLFKGWNRAGGRFEFINALKDGFKAIGAILKTVSTAFRNVFPATTVTDLTMFTHNFARLMKEIMPSPETLAKLTNIFRGLFSVFEIGMEIIKQIGGLFLWLVGHLGGAGAGFLDLAARVGVWLQALDNMLVGERGIQKFFDKIYEFLEKPIGLFKEATQWIQNFYDKLTGSAAAENAVDRLQSRFGFLGLVFDKVKDVLPKIMDVLDKVWDVISKWFSELGSKIAGILQPTDFDAAVDVVNVGLLGGIIVMLRKFLKNVGQEAKPGLFDKIKESLDQLTGTLKSMQTELKAKALMEIAIAIGVLTASIVILSLIDSDKLAKAMIAVGTGFAILVEALKQLDSIGGKGLTGGARLDMLAGAMVMLSTSAVILSGALLILATMSWDDLLHGLAGLAGGLVILVGALKLMSAANISGVVLASGAMVLMSTAIVILAGALKIFGTMSWEDIAKGLLTFAGAMAIIVASMNAMPVFSTIAAGLAMIPIATGIAIIAGALKLMATMSWADVAKGLVTLAAMLALVAAAVNLMPVTLPLIAIGLIKVSESIAILAGVLVVLSMIKLEKMLVGLLGLGGILTILAAGLNAMVGAVPGAIALGIAAVALGILGSVLIKLSQLSIKELLIGLGAIAGVLTLIAVAALLMEPAIPAIFLLGAALGVVGIAFVLFGAGAFLVASAFEMIAHAGTAGTKALITSLTMIIKAIPHFAAALVTSLLDSAKEVLQAADLILRVIVVLVGHILDTVIELLPKVVKVFVALLDAILKIIVDKFPDILDAGFKLLMMFLQGIKDHIAEITQTIVDIVVLIADTLTDNAHRIVDAAVNLLLAFLGAFKDRVGDIAAAGLMILIELIASIARNIILVINLVGTIISEFIKAIGGQYDKIIRAGAEVIEKLVKGIGDAAGGVVGAAADAIRKFIKEIGNHVVELLTAGKDLILKIGEGISNNINDLVSKGATIIIDFLHKLAATLRQKTPELVTAMADVGDALMDGLIAGIEQGAKKLPGPIGSVVGGAISLAKKGFDVKSPSRIFMWIGQMLMSGLAIGIGTGSKPEDSIADRAQSVIDAFQETISRIPNTLAEMDELNPVITPVLDLSKVRTEASKLNDMMATQALSVQASFDQARLIATTTDLGRSSVEETAGIAGPTEVTFEQNIYAPTQLNANDIYRQTNGQIIRAKEELNIS